MKKIFIVINSLNGGGAERVASILSQSLTKTTDLTIVSLESKQHDEYAFQGNIHYLDIDLKKSYVSRMRETIKKFNVLVAHEHPHLIVAFLNNACLVTILSKHQGIKTILSIRNYVDLQYKGKKLVLWQHIYKRFFSRADKIVSVSNEISELMVNKYHLKADKCVTIYNPYDLDAISSACSEKIPDVYLNQMRGKKVIATLGHLGTQKAMERLINVLPSIVQEVPNILLLIIGSTENTKYFQMLKDLAETKQVTDSILFVGSQQNPFKYLHAADAYCLSSQFEGFPNALVEAMACGLPVVATNCHSGPKEIISDSPLSNLYQETEYGILVDGKDDVVTSDGLSSIESNMQKGLVKLLTDDSLNAKYRSQSLKRVKDFSVDLIVEKWQALIASL